MAAKCIGCPPDPRIACSRRSLTAIPGPMISAHCNAIILISTALYLPRAFSHSSQSDYDLEAALRRVLRKYAAPQCDAPGAELFIPTTEALDILRTLRGDPAPTLAQAQAQAQSSSSSSSSPSSSSSSPSSSSSSSSSGAVFAPPLGVPSPAYDGVRRALGEWTQDQDQAATSISPAGGL